MTHQTGPHGKQVNRLYIEEGSAIDREFYLSALVDRETSRVAFVVSTEGGMDIEEVARTPSREDHDVLGRSRHRRSCRITGGCWRRRCGLTGDLAKQAAAVVTKLYAAFVAKDMSLLEINPLVVTKGNELICLDAKIGFDDNALYRHPDIVALRDLSEEDEKEIEASKYDLNYVALDGTIGCMVNGAGLAMATMDIIRLYGEAPANFLDVGGSATKEKVAAAFKIITSDPKVKGILVNIFGGIMKCDVIAEGVVAAVKEVGLQVPLVVRLEGTNVDLGKEIIAKSNLNVISADDLDDAAQKIVKAVKGLSDVGRISRSPRRLGASLPLKGGGSAVARSKRTRVCYRDGSVKATRAAGSAQAPMLKRRLWQVAECARSSGDASRQHPPGRYILDFYCRQLQLALELDGATRMAQSKSDRDRDDWLRQRACDRAAIMEFRRYAESLHLK